MDLPEEARKMGATPRWMGYVGVNDVDATADRIKRLGGAVYVPADRHQYRPHFGRRRSANGNLALVKGPKPGQRQARRARQTGARGLA